MESVNKKGPALVKLQSDPNTSTPKQPLPLKSGSVDKVFSVMKKLSGSKPSQTKPSEKGSASSSKSVKEPGSIDKQTLPPNKTTLPIVDSSWTCANCSLTNESTSSKCIICQTPKISPVPTTKLTSASPPASFSLAAKFTPAAGAWTCDTCMLSNNVESSACIACSTPKPGCTVTASEPSSLTSMFAQHSTPKRSSVGQDNASKLALGGSGSAVAPVSSFLQGTSGSSWTCDTCMVSNKMENSSCVCCNAPKPGASGGSFSNKSSAGGGLSLGILGGVNIGKGGLKLGEGGLKLGEGGFKLGGGGLKLGEGVKLGEGGLKLGEGGLKLGEGGLKLGEGGLKIGEGGLKLGEGGLKLGEGGLKLGEGGLKLGEGGLKLGEGGLKLGEGGLKLGEGGLKLGEGGLKLGEGGLKLGEGGLKLGGESSKLGEGSSKFGEGSCKLGDGSLKLGEGGFKFCEGGLKRGSNQGDNSGLKVSSSSHLSLGGGSNKVDASGGGWGGISKSPFTIQSQQGSSVSTSAALAEIGRKQDAAAVNLATTSNTPTLSSGFGFGIQAHTTASSLGVGAVQLGLKSSGMFASSASRVISSNLQTADASSASFGQDSASQSGPGKVSGHSLKLGGTTSSASSVGVMGSSLTAVTLTQVAESISNPSSTLAVHPIAIPPTFNFTRGMANPLPLPKPSFAFTSNAQGTSEEISSVSPFVFGSANLYASSSSVPAQSQGVGSGHLNTSALSGMGFHASAAPQSVQPQAPFSFGLKAATLSSAAGPPNVNMFQFSGGSSSAFPATSSAGSLHVPSFSTMATSTATLQQAAPTLQFGSAGVQTSFGDAGSSSFMGGECLLLEMHTCTCGWCIHICSCNYREVWS